MGKNKKKKPNPVTIEEIEEAVDTLGDTHLDDTPDEVEWKSGGGAWGC